MRHISPIEWAILFVLGFLSGALVVAGLRYAVEAAWPVTLLVGTGAATCTLVTSWLLLRSWGKRKAAAAVSVLLVPFATGAFMALAVSAQFFWPEVRPDYLEAHFRDIPALERETANLARTIANPPRTLVDQDPTVAPLVRALEDADDKLDVAKSAYLCEVDGTCGTKRSGTGPAAAAKQREVDRRAEDRRAAADALDAARRQAGLRSDDEAKGTVESAKQQLAAEQPRLDRLRAERAEVESGRIAIGERISALTTLFTRQPVTVGFVFLLLLVIYLAPHLVPIFVPRDDDRNELRKSLEDGQLVEQYFEMLNGAEPDSAHTNGSTPAPPPSRSHGS